jgi:RNA polymerase-binding transcription factor DksA
MMTARTDLGRPRQLLLSRLTGQQLAALRSSLSDALVEHRWQLQQHEGQLTSVFADAVAAGAGSELELAQVAAARAREAAADVEAALARFDDHTYGSCEACERPIPFERLQAIPHARFCVACPRPGGRVR